MSVSSEEVGTELRISALKTELTVLPPQISLVLINCKLIAIMSHHWIRKSSCLERSDGIWDGRKSPSSVFFALFCFPSSGWSIVKYPLTCRGVCLFSNKLHTVSEDVLLVVMLTFSHQWKIWKELDDLKKDLLMSVLKHLITHLFLWGSIAYIQEQPDKAAYLSHKGGSNVSYIFPMGIIGIHLS